MFFREPPCFPIGKKTPLDPPLSGGCCRCPPDKGNPSEKRRFVAVVPLIRGIPPKGGGGFAVVPLIRGIPPKGGGLLPLSP